MFRRLLAFIVLVATVTACASKSETSSNTSATQAQTVGPFSVATQFTPDPPKQGPATIIVTVKDASGNPLKGAAVKIVTKMPTMSMSGPTLTATGNGDGTYAAQTNLNYATQWTFDISVSASGKSGVAHVTQDVK
jgi:nitrogen fixation protein FixH